MKGSDYLKEHKELIGLLGNTSQALRKEALVQTQELTNELMKNPTKKNALALAKRGANNLGKRMTTRGKRVVLRRGNVMGSGFFDDLGNAFNKASNDFGNTFGRREHPWDKPSFEQKGGGIFGDLIEDVAVEGAKKLYHFDKEHGSHLKQGLQSGLRNMVSGFFKGGNGVDYRTALSYGRGHGGGILEDLAKKYKQPENRFAVLPDVYEPHPSNDFSGWVEKERRDTGYYGRPAILGEGC